LTLGFKKSQKIQFLLSPKKKKKIAQHPTKKFAKIEKFFFKIMFEESPSTNSGDQRKISSSVQV
jgi:hypothetical protein